MTEVKICGINAHDVMEAALDAGADYVGLVFFEKSPRNVSLSMGRELSDAASGRARSVALLVDPDDELVEKICRTVGPDIIQLHGKESPARVAEIRKLANRSIMKAVPVAEPKHVTAAKKYLKPDALADIILFDAKAPEDSRALPGGNGLCFDWHMLDAVKGKMDYALAGGLTPENVAAAVRLTAPKVVDVSSGVESAPGVKDTNRIYSFIEAAKTAKQTT